MFDGSSLITFHSSLGGNAGYPSRVHKRRPGKLKIRYTYCLTMMRAVVYLIHGRNTLKSTRFLAPLTFMRNSGAPHWPFHFPAWTRRGPLLVLLVLAASLVGLGVHYWPDRHLHAARDAWER